MYLGGYHWFDGDGMIHGVRFSHGQANYINRWTKTERFTAEENAGRPLFIRIGEINGKLGLVKIIISRIKYYMGYFGGVKDLSNGTANTASKFFI